MNQVLDTPAAASSAAALLDLDPNSAGICSFDSQTLNNMLGAAETEDSADIAGTMRRRPLSLPVFQGGRINGAWRLPAGGTKLLGKAIPLKGVETAEESFEGLARDYPFQTFKIRRSKKKEVVSIEFEAVALEAKLLLQGEAVVSICTEFMQNEDNFSLLRNRPLEGGDESDARQKRECEPEAFDKLADKLHKSFPGEVFATAMDSPAPASAPWINASTAAGFPQPDSKTAPRLLSRKKSPKRGTNLKSAAWNLQKRTKMAQFIHTALRMEPNPES